MWPHVFFCILFFSNGRQPFSSGIILFLILRPTSIGYSSTSLSYPSFFDTHTHTHTLDVRVTFDYLFFATQHGPTACVHLSAHLKFIRLYILFDPINQSSSTFKSIILMWSLNLSILHFLQSSLSQFLVSRDSSFLSLSHYLLFNLVLRFLRRICHFVQFLSPKNKK